MIYPLQCCSFSVGGTSPFLDVRGWNLGGQNFLNRPMDFCRTYTVQPEDDESSLPVITYTTEIDVSTIYNSISWCFFRGAVGNRTWHTLSPDCFLSPTGVQTMTLFPNLNLHVNRSSGGAVTLGRLPDRYRVSFDQGPFSSWVTVDGDPQAMQFPVLPPEPYHRTRVDIECEVSVGYLDPINDGARTFYVPYSHVLGSPKLLIEYETDNDVAQVDVEVVSGAPPTPPFVGAGVTDSPSISSTWLPSGSDALPVTAPWFQQTQGPIIGIGYTTPTFGFWQRNEADFFLAAYSWTVNDAIQGSGTGGPRPRFHPLRLRPV